ncbi:flagellar hook-length control protein FliK [Sagittula sp. P11]|uniref:flagellar hook-length control protein FliK n=1 Tax=Sagittula sp. P11 TaxID=2009329 RepID=UPI0012FDCD6C|nr:flagellar hook-length control protein FliK [Sagittula sp. P11]
MFIQPTNPISLAGAAGSKGQSQNRNSGEDFDQIFESGSQARPDGMNSEKRSAAKDGDGARLVRSAAQEADVQEADAVETDSVDIENSDEKSTSFEESAIFDPDTSSELQIGESLEDAGFGHPRTRRESENQRSVGHSLEGLHVPSNVLIRPEPALKRSPSSLSPDNIDLEKYSCPKSRDQASPASVLPVESQNGEFGKDRVARSDQLQYTKNGLELNSNRFNAEPQSMNLEASDSDNNKGVSRFANRVIESDIESSPASLRFTRADSGPDRNTGNVVGVNHGQRSIAIGASLSGGSHVQSSKNQLEKDLGLLENFAAQGLSAVAESKESTIRSRFDEPRTGAASQVISFSEISQKKLTAGGAPETLISEGTNRSKKNSDGTKPYSVATTELSPHNDGDAAVRDRSSLRFDISKKETTLSGDASKEAVFPGDLLRTSGRAQQSRHGIEKVDKTDLTAKTLQLSGVAETSKDVPKAISNQNNEIASPQIVGPEPKRGMLRHTSGTFLGSDQRHQEPTWGVKNSEANPPGANCEPNIVAGRVGSEGMSTAVTQPQDRAREMTPLASELSATQHRDAADPSPVAMYATRDEVSVAQHSVSSESVIVRQILKNNERENVANRETSDAGTDNKTVVSGAALATTTQPTDPSTTARWPDPAGTTIAVALQAFEDVTEEDVGGTDLPVSGASSSGASQANQAGGTQYQPLNRTDPSAVIRQVSEAFARLSDQTVELRLSPEELGRVRMYMHSGEHGLVVNIQADRTETLDLMRRHVDELARNLADAGYENAGFTFGEERRQRETSLGDALDLVPAVDDDLAPLPGIETDGADGLDIRM